MFQNGVNKFITPFPLEDFVVNEVGFAPHPDPFHEFVGAGIAGVTTGVDTMEVEELKAKFEHENGRFGGVAVSMKIGMKDIAQFTLARFDTAVEEEDVTYELVGFFKDNGRIEDGVFSLQREALFFLLEGFPGFNGNKTREDTPWADSCAS